MRGLTAEEYEYMAQSQRDLGQCHASGCAVGEDDARGYALSWRLEKRGLLGRQDCAAEPECFYHTTVNEAGRLAMRIYEALRAVEAA